MNCKRLFYLCVIFTIVVILSCKTYAQEKGRIGLTVKAHLIPDAGISYDISDNIQTRLSTYLAIGDGFSIVPSFSVLLKVSSDETLSTYIGPDITYHSIIDRLFLSIILGARYSICEKINIYGEFGPSLQIGWGGIDGLIFFNTGVGITYFLN